MDGENNTLRTISALQTLCKENYVKKYGVSITESRYKGDEIDVVAITLFVPRPDRSYERREAKRRKALENEEVKCQEKC